MRTIVLSVAAAVCAASTLVSGQWLHHPTPDF